MLGLERSASQDDVKRAYRKLSKELHPDKHKGDKDKEHQYKEVNEAYETLNNPQKRKMYDQFGAAGANVGAGGFDFSNFDFGGGGAGGFSDIFESFFGNRGGGRTARREQGEGIEIEVVIDFMDVVKGVQQAVTIQREITCDECKGSGAKPGAKVVTCNTCNGTGQITRTVQSFFGTIQQSSVCPQCQGAGEVPEEACPKCKGEGRRMESSRVTINIPAGIHDGQTLRIRGEGNAGRHGTPAGDLYVHIRVQPDPRFARDGDDIRSTLIISVPDAALGATKSVLTVQGSVELKIPAGTQPSDTLRIKGKGLPILNTSRHGDHYVELQVEIPKKLSKKEKKLLEEWKEATD